MGLLLGQNIRRHSYELFLDLLSVSDPKKNEWAEKIGQKYSQGIARYNDEHKGIEAEANNMEREMDVERKKTDRFDIGEVFLECSLVICSITLLTKRRLFWEMGMVLGIAGLGVGASGFWVG